MLVLTAEQTRAEEQKANKAGLSYSKMMDHAAFSIYEHLLTLSEIQNYVILCGKGKNGGDGFVLASLLSNAGKTVTVLKLFGTKTDPLSFEKANALSKQVTTVYFPEEYERCVSLLNKADAIVEAVFGTGFHGGLPEDAAKLFSLCNSLNAYKIAVDLPAGIAYGEAPDKNCFHANETVALMCLKPEHIFKPYSFYCGKVSVGNIGVAPTPERFFFSFLPNEIKTMLPPRPYNANKGTFGKGLLIAGSKYMPGASVIAARGALYCGIGLLTLMLPECNLSAVSSQIADCTYLDRKITSDLTSENGQNAFMKELSRCTAVAVGPGMGSDRQTEQTVLWLLKNSKLPLILDADGINVLQTHTDILRKASCPVLITPHPGEMARLTGKSVEQLQQDRIKTAMDFAVQYNVTVLLKGENTVIAAPNGKTAVNPTGCAALARGGSGDLLTGMALAFLCQKKSLFESAVLAAYIHGLAGEIAQTKYTSYSADLKRVSECIKEAFLQIIERS